MSNPQVMAEKLIEAARTHTPIHPLTRSHPFLDAEMAYKPQALVTPK